MNGVELGKHDDEKHDDNGNDGDLSRNFLWSEIKSHDICIYIHTHAYYLFRFYHFVYHYSTCSRVLSFIFLSLYSKILEFKDCATVMCL